MKKIALVIITVLLTFLLASCDISSELEEFSEGLMNKMTENLHGILKEAGTSTSDDDETSDESILQTDGEFDSADGELENAESDGTL